MMEKIIICNIGKIWDGIDRFKIYADDYNILTIGSTIEIYI